MLLFLSDSQNIRNEHTLCVVDNIQGDGNQIILKLVLREDRQSMDERNWNLANTLSEGSNWTLLKVCSLENFNRSYVGYD